MFHGCRAAMKPIKPWNVGHKLNPTRKFRNTTFRALEVYRTYVYVNSFITSNPQAQKRGLTGPIGLFLVEKEHSSLSTPMWAVDPLPLLVPFSRSPPFWPKSSFSPVDPVGLIKLSFH